MKTVITLLLGVLLGQMCVFATRVDANESTPQQVGASCRGTWGITPSTLKGQEPVQFVGDTAR